MQYMKNLYYSSGGKRRVARRLSWKEPALTIISRSQMITEMCHPDETRPLTTRENARLQTFPDDWVFCGSKSSIYRQIGNAVPVNLAHSVGTSIMKTLNDYYENVV